MTHKDGDRYPASGDGRMQRGRRSRRLRLEIDLWRHRLLHPLESLGSAAARFLPYRTRARLLRALGRNPRAEKPTSTSPQAWLRLAGPPASTSQPERPTIICLPLIEWSLRIQRPQHLLVGLASRGWPVLYAGLELGSDAAEIVIDSEPVADGVRVFELPCPRRLRLGEEPLHDEEIRIMVDAFEGLRKQEQIREAVVLCHSPLWRSLAQALHATYGWPIAYDRMDLHEGFSTSGASVAEDERRLIAIAGLITATSGALERVEDSARERVLRLPNACDPDHWIGVSPSPELAHIQKPIIGYFGAISDWFDTALVVELAVARPTWSIVLIGSTWGADIARLEQLPNVHILGERSYDELPSLAASFDVGVIPFKRTSLIEATDPVKLYEMMALGLEVVAPPIPELIAHGDLIHVAEGASEFLQEIEDVLSAPRHDAAVERRRAFARANTWETRVGILESALDGLFPLVSIAIVTFNNRELTELCLDSIARYTVHPNYEIIVVDNASEDGTGRWLVEESTRRPNLRVILNDVNRGFGAACNQAFAESAGEILCFLNNDTVVTRGWLSAMVHTLVSSQEVGLVGPSSNGVANEARVESGYTSLDGLHEWAGDFVWRHDGESFSIPMLALYCAALRREVWEDVGGLDERFEIGMFEDDDFSRRIRRAGYDIRCLRGVWVHHFQEASFGALPKEEYARIYEANRRRFREKWKGAR